jgi:uncharacterized protein
MQSTEKKRLVPCPECGEPSEFSANNQYRPFCTERCKMIDLGIWASEGYRIEAPLTADDLDKEGLN